MTSRLGSYLGRFLLTESVKFTHHSPANPGVVSTSKAPTKVETGRLNAYGILAQFINNMKA